MEPVTVDDLEALARESLAPMAYDYFRSGADEEHTLRRNREAWDEHAIHFRILSGVAAPDTTTRVLGTELATPILVAPTAYHALAHPEAELATMRGTARAGSLYVASTLATRTLEDVAAAAPAAPKWLQLYVHKDRELTLRLVARAKTAGYGAIAVTCDVPVLGRRCADVRNGFALPDGMRMANLEEELPPELRGASGSKLARFVAERHDPTFGWKDLRDLGDACAPLPLVVKGICRADDARRALDHGARAVWVSNHGGRQLDLAPSSAESLVAIAAAVRDAELYVDGGIRSGTHALVALALGARAVFVGRPVIWGLATGGAGGVERVLRLLHAELVRSMQLAGAPDLAALRDDLVQRRR